MEKNKTQFQFNNKNYEFGIRRVGEEHCAYNKKIEHRTMLSYSLHFITYGTGTLIAGDKKFFLGKSNIFLLYPDETYTYYPDPINPWSYIYVDFYGSNIDEIAEYCGFNRQNPIYRNANYSKTAEIMKQLLEAYDGKDVQTVACSAYFMLLIASLISANPRNVYAEKKNSMMYKQFRDILIYINNNFRMNLTLDQIANDMYVSKRQLLYMFHAYAGMTPINYLNRFRISAACEMLRETDLKISAIAKSLGIDDEKYFIRLFSKYMQISPGEYRKTASDEDAFAWLKERDIDFR